MVCDLAISRLLIARHRFVPAEILPIPVRT
jgi:hypothetical protein